jgi:hypothetical protein
MARKTNTSYSLYTDGIVDWLYNISPLETPSLQGDSLRTEDSFITHIHWVKKATKAEF